VRVVVRCQSHTQVLVDLLNALHQNLNELIIGQKLKKQTGLINTYLRKETTTKMTPPPTQSIVEISIRYECTWLIEIISTGNVKVHHALPCAKPTSLVVSLISNKCKGMMCILQLIVEVRSTVLETLADLS